MSTVRNRQTLLLVVFFVVIVLIAFILNQVRRNLEAAVPNPTPSVLYFFAGLEPIDITRIEISNRQAGRKLTLTKVPGGWNGTDASGTAVPVKLTQIPRLLQNLAFLSYNRVMNTSEVDVTSIGLANGGQFEVAFTATGATHTLHIGTINSTQTASYVQVDADSTVYLASLREIASLVALVDSPDATATATP